MKIPFLNPDINSQDINNLNKVIKSGWFAPGKITEKFEDKFAAYLGTKEAVMTASATAALHLSLILAGAGERDEIITIPLSYVATSNVVLYQKAVPIFVDVEPETGLIDIDKIEEKITNLPAGRQEKLKAIIPVHLYGQMVDMKKLKKIADKYNLVIIEDAAHSIESIRDGIRPAQLSFSACFSFHVAKNITSGQGGILATNSAKIANQARLLRRDGVRNIRDKRYMLELGYKYDSTEFQAAMLLGQLNRIKTTHAKRVAVFERYIKGFNNTKIQFPKIVPNSIHACHMFIVWVNPKKRDSIRKALAKKGIETSIHYEPIHLEPYYQKRFHYKKGDFPVAEKLGASTISLPTYSRLSKQSQEYVIKTLKALVQ